MLPEIILEETLTSSQDIWSFGCLIFEFITGRPLFVVDTTGDKDEANDDHFLQMYSILGPFPENILSKWARPRAQARMNSSPNTPKDVVRFDKQ